MKRVKRDTFINMSNVMYPIKFERVTLYVQ